MRGSVQAPLELWHRRTEPVANLRQTHYFVAMKEAVQNQTFKVVRRNGSIRQHQLEIAPYSYWRLLGRLCDSQRAARRQIKNRGNHIVYVRSFVHHHSHQRRRQVTWWFVQLRRHRAHAGIPTPGVPRHKDRQ